MRAWIPGLATAAAFTLVACGSSATPSTPTAPASAPVGDWGTQANSACQRALTEAGASPAATLDVNSAEYYGQAAQIQVLAARYLDEIDPATAPSDDAKTFTDDMKQFAQNSSQIAAAGETGGDSQQLQVEQETLKQTMTELGQSLGVDECVIVLEPSQALLQ